MNKNKTTPPSQKNPTPQKKNSQKPLTQHEIDEEIEESFPASDPPSWTSGVHHRKPQKKDNAKQDNKKKNK